jgi:hypothetical protein
VSAHHTGRDRLAEHHHADVAEGEAGQARLAGAGAVIRIGEGPAVVGGRATERVLGVALDVLGEPDPGGDRPVGAVAGGQEHGGGQQAAAAAPGGLGHAVDDGVEHGKADVGMLAPVGLAVGDRGRLWCREADEHCGGEGDEQESPHGGPTP